MHKITDLSPSQLGKLKETIETKVRAAKGKTCKKGKACGGACIAQGHTCRGAAKTTKEIKHPTVAKETKKPTVAKETKKPTELVAQEDKKAAFKKKMEEKLAAKEAELAKEPEVKKPEPKEPKKITNKELLGTSLVVRDGRTNLVKGYLADLELVPQHLLKLTKESGVSIHLGNVGMPDLNSNQKFKGMVPRGWEETGKTWDSVPAAYNPVAKSVVAGKGLHGSVSPVLHEFFHAVGSEKDFDNSPKLIEIHTKIYDKLTPYLQQGGKGGVAGRQELFAEGSAHVLKNRTEALELYGEDFVNFIEKDVLK